MSPLTAPGTDQSAQADLATESDTERFVPYYSMFHAPGETDASFKLFRPFKPFWSTTPSATCRRS